MSNIGCEFAVMFSAVIRGNSSDGCRGKMTDSGRVRGQARRQAERCVVESVSHAGKKIIGAISMSTGWAPFRFCFEACPITKGQ